MSKVFRFGGIAASVILIIFGVASIVVGLDGRDRVQTELGREKIVGTDDSTIPGQLVDTGSEARAFAAVMRHHALEATGGKTYAEMDRYIDAQGNPTSDESKAAKNANGGPTENPLRQLWVTETALTTALNTAYFAESTATFVAVMGGAMLLVGTGFLVLTLSSVRTRETAAA